MQKASISRGGGGKKHVNGFVDALTPHEALAVPYDKGDKKHIVAQSEHKGRMLAFNNVHVDGVSIFGTIA